MANQPMMGRGIEGERMLFGVTVDTQGESVAVDMLGADGTLRTGNPKTVSPVRSGKITRNTAPDATPELHGQCGDLTCLAVVSGTASVDSTRSARTRSVSGCRST